MQMRTAITKKIDFMQMRTPVTMLCSTMTLPFVTYMLYAYGLLPLVALLYAKRYQICPLVRCIRPLAKCLQEEDCKQWVEQVQECTNPNSKARKRSASVFAHVQHPQDPAFCRYQCFDSLQTTTALDFLECIGSSGCLEPSPYTDICAPISESLSFDTIQPNVLAGQWKKIYTTGWDIWPCQSTEFQPPGASSPEPESWMTAWPRSAGVWRMDLWWKNEKEGKVTFHMTNEMYPKQEWDWSSQHQPSTLSSADATLKTRAVMWGTEAHENWYLLDFNESLEMMLIYYCAYTMDIARFDSMAMVLQKKGQPPITTEQAKAVEQRALELLGKTHGRLQRVKECQ